MTDTKSNFIHELQNPSSLPFIKHTLAENQLVKPGEIFQTLVIGGSYYQNAFLKRYKDNLIICEHSQGEQPPFLTKDDLLAFIKDKVDSETTILAINFAYPLNPITENNVLDGILQSGSKENTFKGLIGERVGKTIEKFLFDKRRQDIKVAVANDTICLLLSGLQTHTWNQLAAGIVGTGLNFAIFLDETTAVNLEAANFNNFTQSEAGKYIDEKSASPGKALYEKEISGAYLYQHFNYLAKKRNLGITEIKSTKELDKLCFDNDKEVAKTAQEIIDHSASLVAAQIAGILEFCKRDLTFIMQGSLYWKGYNYKDKVEKKVSELCPKYRASYVRVLHSDILGAAKLVA